MSSHRGSRSSGSRREAPEAPGTPRRRTTFVPELTHSYFAPGRSFRSSGPGGGAGGGEGLAGRADRGSEIIVGQKRQIEPFLTHDHENAQKTDLAKRGKRCRAPLRRRLFPVWPTILADRQLLAASSRGGRGERVAQGAAPVSGNRNFSSLSSLPTEDNSKKRTLRQTTSLNPVT